MDAHKNFAYSTIATAPSPATSGTTAALATGDGTNFPTPPFNAVIWPAGVIPLASNGEVVRVTTMSGDSITAMTRAQEGSSARTVVVGDQIAAAITAKSLTDIETADALSQKKAFALGKAGAIGATETDNADFFFIVPWDATLAKMKVVLKTAASGAMVVQLRKASGPITSSITWADVTGFSVTFSNGNYVATVDPTDANVSEGDLLGFSVSTGSGRDMQVLVTAVAR